MLIYKSGGFIKFRHFTAERSGGTNTAISVILARDFLNGELICLLKGAETRAVELGNRVFMKCIPMLSFSNTLILVESLFPISHMFGCIVHAIL